MILPKIGKVVLLVIAFIFMLLHNMCIPLIPGDDFLYQFSFTSEIPNQFVWINSVSEFFNSVVAHYTSYNNRIFPHAVLQIMMLFGKDVFNLFNAAIFLLIPFFCVKVLASNGQNIRNAFLLGCILFLFFYCFHIDLGMSYFWTTGSVNYSWMLIPQLYLLYGIISLYRGVEINKTLVIITAILSATTNENVVLSLFLLCAIILLEKRMEKVDRTLMSVLFILGTGGLLMIVSPALSAKAANESIAFSSDWAHLKEYISRMVMIGFHYLMALLLLPIKGFKTLKFTRLHGYLLMLVIFSNLIMYLAPLCEPRTSVFGFVLMVIIILMMVYDAQIDWDRYIKNKLILFSLLTAFIAFNRYESFTDVRALKIENETILSNHKNKNAQIPGYFKSRRFDAIYMDDFVSNPHYEDNRIAAAYYGCKSLKIDTSLKKDREVYSQIFFNQIQNGQLDKNFDQQDLGKNLIDNVMLERVYIDRSDLKGYHIIFEVSSEIAKDLKMINRGNKLNFNHQLKAWLPDQIESHFIEILDFDRLGQNHKGKSYYYNYIHDPNSYSYILLSLYDPTQHNQIGNIIRISL